MSATDVERAALGDRIESALPALGPAGRAELAGVLGRVADALQAERVYVFGSQARGDARGDSDVDVFVVVPETAEPSYRLAQRAYAAADRYSFGLDIVVMPRDEFESRSRARSSLPATVVREGRLLYAYAS